MSLNRLLLLFYQPNYKEHCGYCSTTMVYVPTQKAFYCNQRGAMKELTPGAAQALQDYEHSLTQPPAFSLVDGTPIQTGVQFDRYGRSTYATPGGVTIPKHSMSMVDKLRYEKQGLTPKMDALFHADDERLQATGRTITEDNLELIGQTR